MKKIHNALLIVASAIFFANCGDNKTTTSESSNTTATERDSLHGGTMMADTGTHNMSDLTPAHDLTGTAGPSNFIISAASGGMMEVEAAKLAQQNAASKPVKDLANTLMTDHTKANNELKNIAVEKNIAIPLAMSGEHQTHLEMLRAKTGADFDVAYLNIMDEDHMKKIELFQQASTTLSDVDLKNFAIKTLSTLQEHSEKVKGILKKN